MILTDYLSEWHNGAALDRFLLLPFVPTVVRRSNRGVAERSVAKVTVTNGGSGYLTVSLTAVVGGGAKAVVRPEHIVDGAVTKVTVTEPGTGYTSAPLVPLAVAVVPFRRDCGDRDVGFGGQSDRNQRRKRLPSPLTVNVFMGGGGSRAKDGHKPRAYRWRRCDQSDCNRTRDGLRQCAFGDH